MRNPIPTINIEIGNQEPDEEELDGSEDGKVEGAGVLRTRPPWQEELAARGWHLRWHRLAVPFVSTLLESCRLGAVELQLDLQGPTYGLDSA